jgi:hypothetical protein
MLFYLESLQVSQKSVNLQCVFHSIRFKVNKGWAQRSPFFMPFCKMAGLWDEYFFEVYRGGLLGPNLKISFRLFLHLPFSVFS